MNTFTRVQQVIAHTLAVPRLACRREATIVGDLGAESIDFLDVVFRLEEEFGVRLPRDSIVTRLRGDLAEEEFAPNGVITMSGLARVRLALPEADRREMKAGLNVRDIPLLYTVGTFTQLVAAQLAEQRRASRTSSSATRL